MINPFRIPQTISDTRIAHIDGFKEDYRAGTDLHDTIPSWQNDLDRRLPKTLRIMLLCFVCTFVFFEIRLIYLQLVQSSYYHAQAEVNRLQVTRIYAARGNIFDRANVPLAENEPSFNIILNARQAPEQVIDDPDLVMRLSTVLGIPHDQLTENLRKQPFEGDDTITLSEHITREQAVTFKLYGHEFPELSLVILPTRVYSQGNVFSHLLGYMGKINADEWQNIRSEKLDYSSIDLIGKSGIEKQYESALRGIIGRQYVERDARGTQLDSRIEKQPRAGTDLVLAIDSGLQKVLFESLTRGASAPPPAAVVALDPRTGAIRALVSSPSFDNNLFNRPLGPGGYEALFADAGKPLFDRAVSAQYPSGSTIKPLIALAALEEGIVTKATQFNSTGGIRVSQWFFPDWKNGGHGPTNVIKALAESVNTYFYIIGGGYEERQGLGIERMGAYMKQFGLGASLGIDLPGEAAGFIPSIAWKEKTKGEAWYIGDTYHAAIGQGDILVTPLQVASYTAAIANGGTIWQPYIVQRMIDAEQGSSREHVKTPLRTPGIDSINLETVREGMRAAVTWGSAAPLNGLPITVAGKTGTAQVGGDNLPHAWFTGFAPYENPELVITIIVENAGEGSRVAVPIAYQAFLWYAYNRMD